MSVIDALQRVVLGRLGCPICNGTGQVRDKTCDKCLGAGLA